jgi:hypothetical protein
MREIDYQKITELDPLHVDADIADMPVLNRHEQTDSIVKLGRKMVEAFPGINTESYEESYAALRDLDFVASSLNRHGLNPFSEVKDLEYAMVEAGAAAGSVPRGTITTYVATNPSGARQRSFTGSEEEGVFLANLKSSFDALEVAFHSISGLRPGSEEVHVQNALTATTAAMQIMVSSMIAVKRSVAPHYFTGQIRPFFEPLTIAGQAYAAAGAGQLQLAGIEEMAYGTKGEGAIEHDFLMENLPYMNAYQRSRVRIFARNNNGQSILATLENRYKLGQGTGESLSVLFDLTRMIRKFRYPHQKVAIDNFNLRPEGAVGSGSYTTQVLSELIAVTEERMRHIRGIRNSDT